MLHFELYNGEMTGPLSQKNNTGFQPKSGSPGPDIIPGDLGEEPAGEGAMTRRILTKPGAPKTSLAGAGTHAQ